MTRSLAPRDWLIPGITAGLVAGVTLAVFAAFAETRAGLPISNTYTFLAAAVGGPTISDPGAATAIGVLVLFAGTILWSFGYIYAASKQPQLLTRPLISGAGFGLIVWFVMQAMLVGAGHFTAPTIYTFDRDMVAFLVFFGIPVAFVVSRMLRPR